ncbi:MAG: ABC transporter substrate-binding protein [Acidimicrobiales bacterium]|nr:ABC transporter substrate-binding protein [Acidimicrobiales bacterium]
MTVTNLNPRLISTLALAAALLGAALMLAACSDGDDTPTATGTPAVTGTSTTASPSPTAESGTRQVEADNGTIEVPANPQRVAAIGNASLPFIDLGGEPVGVTEMRASTLALLPEEQKGTFEAAMNLGPSGGEVDLEKLASLEPDLILAQLPTSDFELIKEQLESIAPTVFFGLGTEWKTLADGLAAAGNLTDGLSEQKAEFEAHVATIQETYREIIDDTTFVMLDRYASSDPATFVITHIGCIEIAQDDIGLNLPEHAEGNNGEVQSFEQIGELSRYDVILYPVNAQGQATEPFAPVVETNAWQALPAVTSGHALGVFCPGNNSYGSVLRYLDSLDQALATLPSDE